MNKIALNPSDNFAVDLRRYHQAHDHFIAKPTKTHAEHP